MPLYLLFELKQLISFKPTRFSDGSLARKEHTILDSANDFMNLPFRDIYHNSGWGHEVVSRQDEIKNRRHAEIIYPKRISLDNLAFIVCRSQAEYETLHNILSPALWNRWKHIVAVSKHRRLFNNEWLFVKDVTLNPHSVRVSFNFPVHSRFYGPYSVRVDITDNITGKSGFFSQSYDDIVNALKEPRLDLDVSSFSSRNYTVRVTIDGILSYLGKYTGDDIPF